MICYFDTSAVIPIVIDEAGSDTARSTWRRSEIALSSIVVAAEAHAALAKAIRMGRVATADVTAAVERLERLLQTVETITPTRAVVERAAHLTHQYVLRGYDAIHIASALTLRPDEIVMVTGDHNLRQVCLDLGFGVINTGG